VATEKPVTGEVARSGPDLGRVVDLAVKVVVVLAAILYGFGFLVISIHQYSYGLTEMNPLRPKVLAAGIWFLCFAALPFVLVLEGAAIVSPSPERERWLRSPSTGMLFSASSCYWIGIILSIAFDFQAAKEPEGPSTGTILIVMVVSAAVVFADQWKRFPHWLAVLASLALGGLLIFCGFRDLLHFHGESVASIALWFFGFSYFAHMEMRSRSWRLEAGNWKQSLTLSLLAVAGFAGIYYPHIKPSWGGGAPIPATIYFTKDSSVLPGGSISAKILDEVDGGFYLIGGSDKTATFIPRSEISLVYYSDDSSGPFVVKVR